MGAEQSKNPNHNPKPDRVAPPALSGRGSRGAADKLLPDLPRLAPPRSAQTMASPSTQAEVGAAAGAERDAAPGNARSYHVASCDVMYYHGSCHAEPTRLLVKRR